jgi:hypothetical protein
MPASVSCSCLRPLVASNWPHKGLSPSVIHPCPTHHPPRPRPRLLPHTRLFAWVRPNPEPSYRLVQETQAGQPGAIAGAGLAWPSIVGPAWSPAAAAQPWAAADAIEKISRPPGAPTRQPNAAP